MSPWTGSQPTLAPFLIPEVLLVSIQLKDMHSLDCLRNTRVSYHTRTPLEPSEDEILTTHNMEMALLSTCLTTLHEENIRHMAQMGLQGRTSNLALRRIQYQLMYGCLGRPSRRQRYHVNISDGWF